MIREQVRLYLRRAYVQGKHMSPFKEERVDQLLFAIHEWLEARRDIWGKGTLAVNDLITELQAEIKKESTNES